MPLHAYASSRQIIQRTPTKSVWIADPRSWRRFGIRRTASCGGSHCFLCPSSGGRLWGWRHLLLGIWFAGAPLGRKVSAALLSTGQTDLGTRFHCCRFWIRASLFHRSFVLVTQMMSPNHALQRTRRERRGCNRRVPCAGSLSLGR
jgi:hypothetical protein